MLLGLAKTAYPWYPFDQNTCSMSGREESRVKRSQTNTFLLELPLRVDWSQESHVRAHLETARCLYNALLGEANKRLRRMRNDPAWVEARNIPRSHKQERAQAFSALRKTYRFSEYDLHAYAKGARCFWIAEHIDSTMAQTLATRAYQAANRVCVGKAKRVRFRSAGRGLDSVEGKRNDVGLRFVLDPGVGDGGFLLWNQEVIPSCSMACATTSSMCAWCGARRPLRTRRAPMARATATTCNWS